MITEKTALIERRVTVAPPVANNRQAWRRRMAIVGRWLHIYLSMVSFGILLFFALTGLTLNHPDWFSGKPHIIHAKGQMDARWFRADAAQTSKLDVVEFLRRKHGIKGAVSDYRVDDQQCEISFAGPGYTADAFVDPATGKYDLTETRMGIVAVMNDLHKGRDSGKGWSVVIDVAAVLMTIVSVTGITLIFFLPKRRFSGLVIATAGVAVALVAYLIWVP